MRKVTDKKEKKEKVVTTLKLGDIVTLNEELRAMNKEKDISFVIKFQLVKLLEHTNRLIKPFNAIRLELIKKHGIEVPNRPGQYTLAGSDKDGKGMAALEELLEVEENFNNVQFNLKDFARLQTSTSYIQFFKFIKE